MSNMIKTYVPVLTIAGSDSGGGAGIQADLKTFSALGCFGTSVITATTAQNTLGVKSIHDIPVQHIKEQLEAVLSDIRPKAIKIGMINRPEVVEVIVEALGQYPDIPVVFDPVMVATSGDRLIKEETVEVLKKELFPISHIITPNMDEAAVLIGKAVDSLPEMEKAASQLLTYGSAFVLVKGGHLNGDSVADVLCGHDGQMQVFKSEKITTGNVHGTGCTLSSAIAVFLAKGMEVEKAVELARNFVFQAIDAGKTVKTGQGSGPLNHFHQPKKMIIHELDQ
ncbi:bifunctional hydroxymethylpyrimidine kinase/phosphomethylpyrimidine kinase [Echinicola strongylocentroti]|uniref:hydroxymethylpyrimidine kinase n=1 Tax=Echinicola strongylocentroti TaxID=1795355 RepID=A0A2Z4IGA6_9BACT|nr:bifunctional hydroxymethylpyrimidine kinase/phosphomethylpyrimidine kinase [Echinicola strongylocentroti]AWW30004.1 bifunctional hydroxymethylpyrimidine kinase/phosphomethylpyrimidine kinase [Echinicola strongylocentroti]